MGGQILGSPIEMAGHPYNSAALLLSLWLSVRLLQHSIGQIIKSLPSFCLSVCKHSYGRNFDSILTKSCTVIWGPKIEIEFVWDKKNLITPSLILPQFLKICITAYGDFKAV